jgi:CRISPR-associated protein Cmr6
MRSRRLELDTLRKTATTHAGLWMDRFLEAQTEKDGGAGDESGTGSKAALIRDVSDLKVPSSYREAFQRRRAEFERAGATLVVAEALGRTVIGLGAKGALEAGLRLEHTWGVPILPGTALKGVAATAADYFLESAEWRRGTKETPPGSSYAHLFGTTDESGAVIFHDAWWQPGKGDAIIPIHIDVMTVHHPHYYQDAEPQAPSDMDSPTPIAFASVSGEYLIALEGEPEWREAALEILRMGLAELGIGAKTSSGYGRMKLPGWTGPAAPRTPVGSADRPAGMESAIQAIGKQNAASAVPLLLEHLHGPARKDAAGRVIKQLDRKWLEQRKENSWVQALFSAEREEG